MNNLVRLSERFTAMNGYACISRDCTKGNRRARPEGRRARWGLFAVALLVSSMATALSASGQVVEMLSHQAFTTLGGGCPDPTFVAGTNNVIEPFIAEAGPCTTDFTPWYGYGSWTQSVSTEATLSENGRVIRARLQADGNGVIPFATFGAGGAAAQDGRMFRIVTDTRFTISGTITYAVDGLRDIPYPMNCFVFLESDLGTIFNVPEAVLIQTFETGGRLRLAIGSRQPNPVHGIFSYTGTLPAGYYTYFATADFSAAAEEPGSASVHAMVDVTLTLGTPCSTCAADFDCSGSVGVSDLFAFLDAWFTQFPNGVAAAPSADFDTDGAVTVGDLFAFLDAWFSEFGACGQ